MRSCGAQGISQKGCRSDAQPGFTSMTYIQISLAAYSWRRNSSNDAHDIANSNVDSLTIKPKQNVSGQQGQKLVYRERQGFGQNVE